MLHHRRQSRLAYHQLLGGSPALALASVHGNGHSHRMRLHVNASNRPRHNDFVTVVDWVSSDEIISCGDDRKLVRWNVTTNDVGEAELPAGLYATGIDVLQRKGRGELLAISSSDGKLHLVTRTGKIEKSVEAHRGAALSVRWSSDGTGLITSGEDGSVKMWSSNALLRTVVAQLASAVYAIAWDSSSTRVLYCNGNYCHIKSLKVQASPLKWKAHDATILAADWSSNDSIVTAGEDCRFKVWDAFGRVLFSSSPHDQPITSVAWSPDASLFAAGSYNLLRLCDQAGWSHSLQKMSCGSLLSMSWSKDGTQLAAAAAKGFVLHAHLVDKRIAYRNWELVQVRENAVDVRDVAREVANERLETKHRIVHMTAAFDHVLLLTTAHVYIYDAHTWNAPATAELKGRGGSLLVTCPKLFAVGDGEAFAVFTYDGRLQKEIKVPGTGARTISEKTTSLSSDVLAICEKSNPNTIHLLPTSNSGSLPEIVHEHRVVEVALSQCGGLSERLVAFRDERGGVFVAMVKTYGAAKRVQELGRAVEQLCFNESNDMLLGLGDSRLTVWTVPSVAFAHRALLDSTVLEKPVQHLGRFPKLICFADNCVMLRRGDGSLTPTYISPLPSSLLQCVSNSKWDHAIRICRTANDNVLWSTLAALATQHGNAQALEISYAALNEYSHAAFIASARNVANNDVRQAMTLLASAKISEADALLQKTGHIFNAVMLNVKMFRWQRALQLAGDNNDLLEIVMAHRQRYLEQKGVQETDKAFLAKAAEVESDWQHVKELMKEFEAKTT